MYLTGVGGRIGTASSSGDFEIFTDTIALAGNPLIQTNGNLTIKPYSAGKTVGVGSGQGNLSLTEPILQRLNWGTAATGKTLTLGATYAADLAVNTTSTILNKNVTLLTGTDILIATNAFTHAGASSSTLTALAYGNIRVSTAITALNTPLGVVLQADYDANSSGFIAIASTITTNGADFIARPSRNPQNASAPTEPL